MRKDLFKGFSCYRNIFIPDHIDFVEEDITPDIDDSELNKILNEIFVPDPITGMPKGDIAYFLSKDGNPVVKAWLETNLLSPRSSRSGTSLEGVTDELIAEYARKPNENYTQYAKRLASIRDEAVGNIEKLNAQLNNPE